MFNEKFLEILKHEGVVSIVTSAEEAHVVNTWNSYLVLEEEDKILIPAAAMIKTEENVLLNPKVKLTLGSKEVMGYQHMGAGFMLEGTARFLREGESYDRMYKKYPFLTRVLEVTVTACKQTI